MNRGHLRLSKFPYRRQLKHREPELVTNCHGLKMIVLRDRQNFSQHQKMLKREPELNANWGTICPPLKEDSID
jgi:hypothetical protein